VLTLIPCPVCGAPAEVTERFTLQSTGGPADHIAVGCLDGHHFRMLIEQLPRDCQVLLEEQAARMQPANPRLNT